MLKSFDVKYMGNDKIDGTDTVKLELVPKSDKARNTFDHIWLWIDPSLRQCRCSGHYFRLNRVITVWLNTRILSSIKKFQSQSSS